MKRSGTRYNSRWDASTFLMLALVIAVCIWPVFIEVDVWFIVLTFFFIGLILFIMLGIYYRIEGDKLIVYQFFRPTVFSIAKISEIKSLLNNKCYRQGGQSPSRFFAYDEEVMGLHNDRRTSKNMPANGRVWVFI